MAKQKSKSEIAMEISDTAKDIYFSIPITGTRDKLVSALVFIQKAKDILKSK